MKKGIVLGALGLLTLASCVKEYKCLCTEPTGNGNRTLDISARKKSDAEAFCDAESGQMYGYNFTCELE